MTILLIILGCIILLGAIGAACQLPKTLKCRCGHKIPIEGTGWYTCTECRQTYSYFDQKGY